MRASTRRSLVMRKCARLGLGFIAAVAVAVTLSGAPRALAQESGSPSATSTGGGTSTKVGYLSCNVASGWGIIFGSSRHLDCTYTPIAGTPVEKYKGSITKFGADIGYLQSG